MEKTLKQTHAIVKEVDDKRGKIVEIPYKEFEELVWQYKECQKMLEQREKVIDYLNEQIREYNKKFT